MPLAPLAKWLETEQSLVGGCPAVTVGAAVRAFSGLFRRSRASSLEPFTLVAVELRPGLVEGPPRHEHLVGRPVLAEQRA
jgi:hypothetical protein